ncbi:MAG: hypothetical protein FWH29_02165 [Methanobrevibacter sp.]|nr:hypothetical protein [Methanobrevibacter sp.]
MNSIQGTLAIISLIIGIFSSLFMFRNKLMVWAKDVIGNYWKLVEIEAMLLEVKIKDAVDRGESIYYVLKLYEKYKSIPMENKKERNGHVGYIVKKYVQKEEITK